ncbi:MAG: M24 family metallopeptidase [Planctomycetales bacterium]
MLTEAGCRARRTRLWERLPREVGWALVTNPDHLNYFAGFHPSPFEFRSQSARGVLILGRGGEAILFADNVQEPYAQEAFVTERVLPVWYRCVESAGDRGALLMGAVRKRMAAFSGQGWAYESAHCPVALVEGCREVNSQRPLVDLTPIVGSLRRAKHSDEVALIRESMRVATAALRGTMATLRPGMSELDAYRLVALLASEAAGRQVAIYGDFVSGVRCESIGGPPSARTIAAGELVLLDFSVVLDGYRGDFCNTFACGGQPAPQVRAMFEACRAAMEAGESQLRPGVSGREVHAAVYTSLERSGMAQHFPHHSGHGVGLSHPEPPYLVPQSSETLAAGDVVTLEPGLYVPGLAGMRYERCYLITDSGFEVLSNHPINIETG